MATGHSGSVPLQYLYLRAPTSFVCVCVCVCVCVRAHTRVRVSVRACPLVCENVHEYMVVAHVKSSH